jgi:phenylalanine-4-hydroxylase
MNKTYAALPNYLKRYVVEQDYDSYTPQEHATWRYIMRRSRSFFGKHAVPVYTSGLAKTGIPIDRIPRINEIDAKLKEFGWGAIGVCGFIPPAAFLEFQTLGIMPIAMDMRTIEHVAYTPAPDIVHEAAGHVPVVADPAYRTYLRRYADMASKVIITREDVLLYEAIRVLSDIKENPDTTPSALAAAEANLKAASEGITHVSELAHVSRLAWWTTEYGLVGPLEDPKIFGAGLLSSVGESQHCLSPRVRKVRLTRDCINQTYDITEPQPQLFVAESMEQLPEVLAEVEATLAFKTGGRSGLDKALKAESVNTIELDSGVAVSGELTHVLHGAGDTLEFIKFKGPVQLAWAGRQIPGQGRERHPHGFSSPVGFWKKFPDRAPQDLTEQDLVDAGLIRGRRCELEFQSGFKVSGTLWHVMRRDGKIQYLTWNDVSVKRGSEVFYEPSWGEFDMIVGCRAASVFGGPADRETYGEYELGSVSTSPGRSSPYTPRELKLFECYSRLRSLRESAVHGASLAAALEPLAKVAASSEGEWLLALEILELAKQKISGTWEHAEALHSYLDRAASQSSVNADLIKNGRELLAVH